MAKFITGMLKQELKSNPLRVAGAVLAKGAFDALKSRMNPDRYGGAPLLGVRGNILKAHGFETFEAAHGAEALRQLEALGAVDLALVDWNMPEMNGLEFVKAVRKEGSYDGVRLIMVTTEAEMPRMAEALESGANEYLMKPFTKEALHDKLVLVGLSS